MMTVPEIPASLARLDLKKRLTWLYAAVFRVPPVVMSSLPDHVVDLMRMQFAAAGDVKDVENAVFEAALNAIEQRPRCMRAMFEWGAMGMGYTVFRTPACFFIPDIIFGMEGVRPPLAWLDSMEGRLRRCLEESWEQDKEI